MTVFIIVFSISFSSKDKIQIQQMPNVATCEDVGQAITRIKPHLTYTCVLGGLDMEWRRDR